jgi:hypothetical protein
VVIVKLSGICEQSLQVSGSDRFEEDHRAHDEGVGQINQGPSNTSLVAMAMASAASP